MIEFHVGRGPHLFLDEASALDVQGCVVGGVDIAPGKAVPDDGDPRILHSVGGFLFTCGPDHIRHPEPIEGRTDGRTFPLHGSLAGTPAVVISNEQSSNRAEISATVVVELAQGGAARLERRWTMDGVSGATTLSDRVVNVGDTSFPPVFMYHMNIGAHLFDNRTRLDGAMFEGGSIGWKFGNTDMKVFCVPATVEPGHEEAAMALGPIAGIAGRTLKVAFSVDTLPHLQMWRNQERPAHVLGIEPVSHRWVSRAELLAAGELDLLQPGESRDYSISFIFED
jgi:hypothetical protein